MGAGYGRHAESEPPPLRNAGNEPPNRQDEFVYKALPLDTGAESSTRPSETSELCKLEGFCRRLVLTSGEAWDPSWTPPAWVMRASCARSAAKREIHHIRVWTKRLGKLAKRLYHSSTEQLRTGSAETLPAIVMRWMGEDVCQARSNVAQGLHEGRHTFQVQTLWIREAAGALPVPTVSPSEQAEADAARRSP